MELWNSAIRHRSMTDEIGADLKIKQYREEGQELLKALETYYKVFYLNEDIEDEDEDGDQGE